MPWQKGGLHLVFCFFSLLHVASRLPWRHAVLLSLPSGIQQEVVAGMFPGKHGSRRTALPEGLDKRNKLTVVIICRCCLRLLFLMQMCMSLCLCCSGNRAITTATCISVRFGTNPWREDTSRRSVVIFSFNSEDLIYNQTFEIVFSNV